MVKKTKTTASSSEVSSAINTPETLRDGLPLPKVVVFDLDYTLWPFWVDTHPEPPFKANADHTACFDKYNTTLEFFPDVPNILPALRKSNITVGVASRTHAPDLAKQLLRLLHVKNESGETSKAIEMFDHMEIYPGDKKTHFHKLKNSIGVEHEEMLFFDDERRNRNVEELGVTMYLVSTQRGVCNQDFDLGVREWRKRRGRAVGGGAASASNDRKV